MPGCGQRSLAWTLRRRPKRNRSLRTKHHSNHWEPGSQGLESNRWELFDFGRNLLTEEFRQEKGNLDRWRKENDLHRVSMYASSVLEMKYTTYPVRDITTRFDAFVVAAHEVYVMIDDSSYRYLVSAIGYLYSIEDRGGK